uniref:Uncharacterized protein n=1 Tax=Arundo donax TaxID=35708 RepID=A0A0A9H1Z9_ARUDO
MSHIKFSRTRTLQLVIIVLNEGRKSKLMAHQCFIWITVSFI